ncbi:MAG: DUF1015 domain-containing protein [Clostridia bacterium]|nr:DUF1015 domain-containing protein [Clostridia bacterium]
MKNGQSSVQTGKFLLPKDGKQLALWPVVACDQFTSQPEYWERVEQRVKDALSTFRLILPECWLADSERRVPLIQRSMREYLQNGVLSREVNGLILIKRETAAGARLGVLLCVDLEQYDFAPDSLSPIRPTEGTIPARIPPRLKVRQGAALELSHILLLADDPGRTLIEPLYEKRETLPLLYDIELMEGGGRLTGWAIEQGDLLDAFFDAVSRLKVTSDGLEFAVGDGNHSLATAKAHWLSIRDRLDEKERESHPARFCMAELVNLHDEALVFEPIHRVIFHRTASEVRALLSEAEPVMELERPDIVLLHQKGDFPLRFARPLHKLPVGTLQKLLDRAEGLDLDYVHGEEAVRSLVRDRDAVGILLPPMEKRSLFPSVRQDGPLPRKAFSLGEAHEKRYYMEARRIIREQDAEQK